MPLHSFSFITFFSIVFVLFWSLPTRLRWIWLLVTSYYFYASWKPAYLVWILLTTVVSYLAGVMMMRQSKNKSFIMGCALLINVSILFLFKYYQFFSISLHTVSGISLPQFKLLLPIGISFYTLQTIGYLLDVYKNKIKPERHLGYFSLFVCFFPLLSAGPIERAGRLLPQLKKPHQFSFQQAASGVQLFSYGLFKKSVLADNLAIVVDRVFGALPEYKGLSLLLAVIFYSWQIYMDFSGYTDMARGIARMIGIDLIENFHLPYLASSIRDFWRRWHISLSSWFRDYIYIPLGGNKKGIARMILSTLVVFGLSGLWHGAATNFIIWGLLHGALISIERIIGRLTIYKSTRVPKAMKILFTYFVVSMLWLFFRLPTIPETLYVLRNMWVGARHFISPFYWMDTLLHLFEFNELEIIIGLTLLSLAVIIELTRYKVSLSSLLARQPAIIRFAFYTLIMFAIIQFRQSMVKDFIYVRF